MSIGNLKTEGNKGTNFPFQLKVLQGLQSLVGNLNSVQRTPGVISSTGAGSTTAGWYSFSIANVGGASGTVDGVSIPAGTTLNFDGGTLNHTLASIAYDATGTTFIITFIS